MYISTGSNLYTEEKNSQYYRTDIYNVFGSGINTYKFYKIIKLIRDYFTEIVDYPVLDTEYC